MMELKNSYRFIFIMNSNEGLFGAKAADAMEIHCDDAFINPKGKTLGMYNPDFDLKLEEDDEIWSRVKNIVTEGIRSHG